MSVVAELVNQGMPLAASEVAGMDTAVLIALAATATGAATVRKLTPHWHDTINAGYVGVLMQRGDPVEKTVGRPWQIGEHDLMPRALRERQHRYFPHTGHFVSEEELAEGSGRYVVLPPDWYFIGPYLTIQPVNVADQPADLKIPFEARDGKHRKKLDLHAELAWHIDPTDDGPVDAITKIQHEMVNKKDTEGENKAKQEKNMEIKKLRVTGVAASGFSRAISELDLEVDQLYGLANRDPQAVERATIRHSEEELSRYGFVLRSVRLVSISRRDAEVTGDSFGRARMSSDEAAAAAAALAAREEAEEAAQPGQGAAVPTPIPDRLVA